MLEWFLDTELVHGFAFCFPLHLEVGFWVKEGIVIPFKWGKFLKSVHFIADPLVVFWVVSLEAEFASWLEHTHEAL